MAHLTNRDKTSDLMVNYLPSFSKKADPGLVAGTANRPSNAFDTRAFDPKPGARRPRLDGASDSGPLLVRGAWKHPARLAHGGGR